MGIDNSNNLPIHLYQNCPILILSKLKSSTIRRCKTSSLYIFDMQGILKTNQPEYIWIWFGNYKSY